jgi:hypothetical protein
MIVLLRGIGGSLHRSQHFGEAASMRFEVWLSEPLRASTRLLLDQARKGDAARRGSLPPNHPAWNLGNQPGRLAAKRKDPTAVPCERWVQDTLLVGNLESPDASWTFLDKSRGSRSN